MENIANIIATATHYTIHLEMGEDVGGPRSVVLSGPNGAIRVERLTGAVTTAAAADAVWDGAQWCGHLKRARSMATRWMAGDTRP